MSDIEEMIRRIVREEVIAVLLDGVTLHALVNTPEKPPRKPDAEDPNCNREGLRDMPTRGKRK